MKEGLSIPKLQEHLIKGISPIMACLSSMEGGKSNQPGNSMEIGRTHNSQIGNIGVLDWGGGEYLVFSEKRKSLSGGSCNYLISAIDDADKFSDNFYACTGLIVVGRKKNTKENISFVTHQSQISILSAGSLIDNLGKQLSRMKNKCELGTIDAVIIGGEYMGNDSLEKYKKATKSLGEEVQKVLNFEPVVINGPKNSVWVGDGIYFDNENRRLYFVRPKITQVENPPGKDFLPADFPTGQVDKYKDRWK